MKKLIFGAALILGSVSLFAQDNQDNRDNRNNRQNNDSRTRNGNRNQAPSEVQQAWQRDHANDGTPTWRQTNGQWNAHYQDKTNNRTVDSYYDRSGRQIDTHQQWDRKDMPDEYNQNIDRRYHTNGNYDVTRIERPNQKHVYQVRMKSRNKRRTVYTDEHGNEIKYREPHSW